MHTAHVHILRGSSARPRPVPLRRWLQRIQIYTHPPATLIILPRAALYRLRVVPEQAIGAVKNLLPAQKNLARAAVYQLVC